MVENKNEVSKDLEKALQALEQAKQRIANEKKKQNEKKRKAEVIYSLRVRNAHRYTTRGGMWNNNNDKDGVSNSCVTNGSIQVNRTNFAGLWNGTFNFDIRFVMKN